MYLIMKTYLNYKILTMYDTVSTRHIIANSRIHKQKLIIALHGNKLDDTPI